MSGSSMYVWVGVYHVVQSRVVFDPNLPTAFALATELAHHHHPTMRIYHLPFTLVSHSYGHVIREYCCVKML